MTIKSLIVEIKGENVSLSIDEATKLFNDLLELGTAFCQKDSSYMISHPFGGINHNIFIEDEKLKFPLGKKEEL